MREFIELLEKYQVEYVVVGGFAVNYYGYIRTTQDIDILIFPFSKNAQNLIDALDEFGLTQVSQAHQFDVQKLTVRSQTGTPKMLFVQVDSAFS